jgi:hypothetical protein
MTKYTKEEKIRKRPNYMQHAVLEYQNPTNRKWYNTYCLGCHTGLNRLQVLKLELKWKFQRFLDIKTLWPDAKKATDGDLRKAKLLFELWVYYKDHWRILTINEYCDIMSKLK